MQKHVPGNLKILAAAIASVLAATSYANLKKDGKGNVIHSGFDSGGNETQSARTKIELGAQGKPATITIGNPATGKDVTLTTGEAEVMMGQTMSTLAAINQGLPVKV
ncbi:MAG TPA: hypothetical protein VMV71_00975 [Candidatus Paceibacterota bacterium]|nr:hypothetical protein [Candidatus Paceibacterota bacterium]